MIRTILSMAALAVAALSTTPALATEAREPTQVTVSVAGVDFNNAQDVKMVYAKINAAADRVCASDVYDPQIAVADKACARQAISTAVAEINRPQLSQLDGQTRLAMNTSDTKQN